MECNLEPRTGSDSRSDEEHSMTIAPARTTPLYSLSHRALSLGDGEIADLVESLSTSSALAESWKALRGAIAAEGVTSMLDRARADAWSPAMSCFDARVFSVVEEAYVAVAFRALIGRHGFELEHYEAMTGAWRILVGPVHAEDPDLTPTPAAAEAHRSAETTALIETLPALDLDHELSLRRARGVMGLNQVATARKNASLAITATGRALTAHFDALRLIAARPDHIVGPGLAEARYTAVGLLVRDVLSDRDRTTLTAPWLTVAPKLVTA